MEKVVIGIIGFGNMGSAIAESVKKQYSVVAFDKDKNKTANITGSRIADSLRDLVAGSNLIILAVKPQDFDTVLQEIGNTAKGKLIITIAAGIQTAYIEKVLGNVRVVRAMPNIGAKIGASVTCLSKGVSATEEDASLVKGLFDCLGKTNYIEEKMMNAATAISGSGPAYVFDFIEKNSIYINNMPERTKYDIIKRLARAAESVGFNAEQAAALASDTVESSLKLVKAIMRPVTELKQQVASKGGTTEAGLEVLDKGGSWEEAAQAALRRAEELSKKE